MIMVVLMWYSCILFTPCNTGGGCCMLTLLELNHNDTLVLRRVVDQCAILLQVHRLTHPWGEREIQQCSMTVLPLMSSPLSSLAPPSLPISCSLSRLFPFLLSLSHAMLLHPIYSPPSPLPPSSLISFSSLAIYLMLLSFWLFLYISRKSIIRPWHQSSPSPHVQFSCFLKTAF